MSARAELATLATRLVAAGYPQLATVVENYSGGEAARKFFVAEPHMADLRKLISECEAILDGGEG